MTPLPYHRVLALIDPSPRGETVARRALHLAQATGAELFLARILNYHAGFESDHVPFLTPTQMKQALERDTLRAMAPLLTRLGLPGKTVTVVADFPDRAFRHLLAAFQPDLVVAGSHDPPESPAHPDAFSPFDLMLLPTREPPPMLRLWRQLTLLLQGKTA